MGTHNPPHPGSTKQFVESELQVDPRRNRKCAAGSHEIVQTSFSKVPLQGGLREDENRFAFLLHRVLSNLSEDPDDRRECEGRPGDSRFLARRRAVSRLRTDRNDKVRFITGTTKVVPFPLGPFLPRTLPARALVPFSPRLRPRDLTAVWSKRSVGLARETPNPHNSIGRRRLL